jgi:uncharacterized membrane protein
MSGTVFYGCFWLAVLAFVMIGSLWIFRVPQPEGDFPRRRRLTPRNILDARYAYGEIDREEYLQRRLELGT